MNNISTQRTKIPVVDLGELSVSNENEPSQREWERVGEEVARAFSDIGFVYLANHGIQQKKIEEINQISGEFFMLDKETKLQYKRGVQTIQGYSAPNQERLTSDQTSCEERESFDVQDMTGVLPDEEVPRLRPALTEFTTLCKNLTSRLLTAMAVGLDLERSYFTSKHTKLGSTDNSTSIRMLYYPPLPTQVPPDTTRIPTHTDYGTITLLFQDNIGGLEVRDRSDSWVSAEPIPDTILVNVGDILQFWTADKFRATEHRVLIPAKEIKRSVPRRSLAFFVHPDHDVLISPLDGSSRYSPVFAKKHSEKRFAETYIIRKAY